MKPIELLSPAKNADVGIEAIRHGADAVYIGGPAFGARAAAGNSIEDIARLCNYAHLFQARVYVTLNTILYDNELVEAERLIRQLYEIGVDALIIQDLAILELNIPPIALHASTQMDNCTAEKALFLEKAGFSQIVVARELSLRQIHSIAQATTLPIEAFVHGALCVSYSGRCYVSQHCFERSANRGKCAQFCRLQFSLTDAEGKVISTQHHLSLRDMNRTNSIEEMLRAGVSSFKIEGRLKDVTYVKNVTAHYRQAIDSVLEKYPDLYRRSSYGYINQGFTPQVEKSFNRGFTEYYLHGRTLDVASMQTPKAIGAFVGRVEKLRHSSFVIKSEEDFANGDGLCYFDAKGQLHGFRINKVVGKELFPLKIPSSLRLGTTLFRNEDRAFEKQLNQSKTERLLRFELYLTEMRQPEGYLLRAETESGICVSLPIAYPHQIAKTSQTENIRKQLMKWGGTPYLPTKIHINLEKETFIPSSHLTEWRRQLSALLTEACLREHPRDYRRKTSSDLDVSNQSFDYTANISNHLAKRFLERYGAVKIEKAYEIQRPSKGILMTCRHCLRYAHGQCPKETGHAPRWKEPLALTLPNGKRFPLSFDCVKCEMQVHYE